MNKKNSAKKVKPPQPPDIRAIESIKLPVCGHQKLANEIPVWLINMGTQDVLKIEIIIEAGRWHEEKKLVASAVGSMLKEGTLVRDTHQINEAIEYFGATLKVYENVDSASLVLYCLKRYFGELAPLIREMLTSPLFSENELKQYIERRKSSLEVDLQRNDFIAYRQFTAYLFGETHPYGYNTSPELLDQLTCADLFVFFKKNYHAANYKIILSGKIDEVVLQVLSDNFENLPKGESHQYTHLVVPHPQRVHRLAGAGDVQASLYIGRRLVNRHHPDFPRLFVLNALLGGFFGSRLMQNLRENKGYTYGIYSSLETMGNEGIFYITAEVDKKRVKQSIAEIYTELERLRNEKVQEEELLLVRNYLMGYLLSALDGAFAVSETAKMLATDGLGWDYLECVMDVIQTITPAELQRVAMDYLQPADLYEVVVGA